MARASWCSPRGGKGKEGGGRRREAEGEEREREREREGERRRGIRFDVQTDRVERNVFRVGVRITHKKRCSRGKVVGQLAWERLTNICRSKYQKNRIGESALIELLCGWYPKENYLLKI